jgi:hypothetical protein
MFYSPVTLKLGRQYLHYGRGLIISSVEQEYNFDAARLVLDLYPVTIDFVYANVNENTPFGGAIGSAPNDQHLLFLNARYEMSDSVLKNLEGYFGWLVNSQPLSSTRNVPPGAYGASPMLIGGRADLNLTEGLETWAEAAYEFGPDGFAGSSNLSAFIATIGASFSLSDVEMSPVINASYTYASGGGSDGQNAFRPWFNYQDGYNGYLFSPILSNIQIFNLGVTVTPCENTTLALQGYYYMAADTTGGNPGVGLVGNPNIDNGGLGYSPSGSPRDLGFEIDTILGYDYSKDVSFQLVYGAFIPMNAYTYWGSSTVAHEVRAEVNARF